MKWKIYQVHEKRMCEIDEERRIECVCVYLQLHLHLFRIRFGFRFGPCIPYYLYLDERAVAKWNVYNWTIEMFKWNTYDFQTDSAIASQTDAWMKIINQMIHGVFIAAATAKVNMIGYLALVIRMRHIGMYPLCTVYACGVIIAPLIYSLHVRPSTAGNK